VLTASVLNLLLRWAAAFGSRGRDHHPPCAHDRDWTLNAELARPRDSGLANRPNVAVAGL